MDKLWWLPNAVVMLIGTALVGIGVYDHDNQSLMLVGTGLVTGAAGHMMGASGVATAVTKMLAKS